jgi:hypothetical protein
LFLGAHQRHGKSGVRRSPKLQPAELQREFIVSNNKPSFEALLAAMPLSDAAR